MSDLDIPARLAQLVAENCLNYPTPSDPGGPPVTLTADQAEMVDFALSTIPDLCSKVEELRGYISAMEAESHG